MNILGLSFWQVLDFAETAHDMQIEARCDIQPSACLHCGCVANLYKHGVKQQRFMDLPIRAKRVGILAHRQRYKCRECSQTFMQPLPDMDDKRLATKRLIEYIAAQGFRKTFTSLADEVGVDERTIRNIFAEGLPQREVQRTLITPTKMGMDELWLRKAPRCIITNLSSRSVYDLLEDRNKSRLVRYLSLLPGRKEVQVVCIDMWPTYRDAVRVTMPDALIVVDKWHVQKLANKALDDVRKRLGSQMTDAERRRLMRNRTLLQKHPTDLNETQFLKLDTWLRNMPDLKTAYDVKEGFYALWDLADKAEVMDRYDEWQRQIPDAFSAQYEPLVRAVRNWKPEILAYFDSGVTNGVTEALNGLVKNVNRNGRGYTFDVIRAKVVLGNGLKAEHRPRYGDAWKAADKVAEVPATYIQGELDLTPMQEHPWSNLIFLCFTHLFLCFTHLFLCFTHHSQDHIEGFHTDGLQIQYLDSTRESE